MAGRPARTVLCWNKPVTTEKIKGKLCFPLILSHQKFDSSALTRLEARIAFADHEYLAMAAHDLAVAVARLGGFE